MSGFTLKIIAMISMIFDHTGYLIFNELSPLNYIGRFAFPIFAFEIGQGFTHTKNLKKYFLRLFIFALISQIPFQLFLKVLKSSFSLNIFFTLFLGLLSLYTYNLCKKNKFIALTSVLCISIIAYFLHVDYGWYGILIIFILYIFQEKKLCQVISFILATLINYLIKIITNGFYFEYIYLFIFTCFSLFFINFYNGKKGKNVKFIFYLFYPLHLIIIYKISDLFC